MTAKQHLVLVPGLLCAKGLWADQLAGLGDVAKMTVADHTRHNTMERIARSILDDAPDRFALAGLSMGGYISYEIVRQAPDRVTRLALLDTGSRADAPERAEGRRKLIELAEREGTRKAQEALLPVLIHKARLADKPLVEAVLAMADEIDAAAFKRQQEAIMGRPDNRPLLPSIKVPALVLVGREDALTPVAMSQEIVAGIPGARLEIVPECGHLSTMERPDAVNRALRAWLAA
jgi:pimeloyl-ACP methyl ester carboxylesterase